MPKYYHVEAYEVDELNPPSYATTPGSPPPKFTESPFLPVQLDTRSPTRVGYEILQESSQYDNYPQHDSLSLSRRPWTARVSSFASKWWLWEWLSCVLAFVCLASLMTILFMADGKPVRSWTYGWLTFNTMVAFLSTTLRLALMVPLASAMGQQKWIWFQKRPSHDEKSSFKPLAEFESLDSASRGPGGSVLFLGQHLPKSLAYLGAVLTIASLGLSTFTQLVVGIDLSQTHQNGTLPQRAERFSTPVASGGQDGSKLQSQLSVEFAAVIDQMFTLSEPVAPLTPACETGNCTWPVFPTLAACGRCHDSSSLLHRICGVHRNSPTEDTSTLNDLTYCVDSATPWPDSQGPKYGLMNGLPVFEDYQRFAAESHALGAPEYTTGIFHADTFLWHSNDISNATLFSFRVQDNTGSLGPAPLLQTCEFFMCVQTLNLSVTNGRITSQVGKELPLYIAEHEVGNNSVFQSHPSVSITFDTSDMSSYGVDTSHESSRWGFYDIGPTFKFENLYLDAVYGAQPPFRADQIDYKSRFKALRMWAHKDMDVWVKDAATSLTNSIRQHGETTPTGKEYRGTELTLQPIFEIMKIWLVFPVSILVLMTVFFVSTLVISCRRKVEPWKNELLPLLYTTLDDKVLKKAAKPMDVGEARVVWARTRGHSRMDSW